MTNLKGAPESTLQSHAVCMKKGPSENLKKKQRFVNETNLTSIRGCMGIIVKWYQGHSV